jgi:glycosyltransferase involved in cell wall biosynthesis
MDSINASVIVATYNQHETLKLCIESLWRQSTPAFEVIVADDGSGPDTAAIVGEFKTRFGPRLHHVRHDDQGFRLAAIRNRAIEAAQSDYLIFLDGDCFVLPDFVETHLALATPGTFVSGKRSYLRKAISMNILAGVPLWLGGTRGAWLARGLVNQCTRALEFIPLGDGEWRYRRAEEWRGAQACNLGVARGDLEAVDGFDERYQGHGAEDSDLVIRLMRNGVRRKLGDHGPVVLHLWHERRIGTANSDLFESVRADESIVRAGIGLSNNADETTANMSS